MKEDVEVVWVFVVVICDNFDNILVLLELFFVDINWVRVLIDIIENL